MAPLITVRLDASLPPGKFAISVVGGCVRLHALSFTYGQRLASGGCSCERVEDILTTLAEELGIEWGKLELRVGE